ncbi:MAG: hypothetical protein MUF73_06465 [Rhodobacteraceae bacterium]|jgi:hypothetical protein|nr:hypothetical protein [Paracoccaceae bacterium]
MDTGLLTMTRRRLLQGAAVLWLVAGQGKAEELNMLRPGTEEDKAEILRLLGGRPFHYDVLDRPADQILVSDGDLVVRGDWHATGMVAVFGNLVVDGVYFDGYVAGHDMSRGSGQVVVFGDMAARDIYNTESLHVSGDLTVKGLVLAVGNDMPFFVEGVVNARGLISSDKFADYRVGELGFWYEERNDAGEGFSAQQELAWRALKPDVFTSPDWYDPPQASWGFRGLFLDQEMVRQRLLSGESAWRDRSGSPSLTWDRVVEAATEPVTDERLVELLALDPLLAQVIAARSGNSDAVVATLRSLEDPRVDEWLSLAP